MNFNVIKTIRTSINLVVILFILNLVSNVECPFLFMYLLSFQSLSTRTKKKCFKQKSVMEDEKPKNVIN